MSSKVQRNWLWRCWVLFYSLFCLFVVFLMYCRFLQRPNDESPTELIQATKEEVEEEPVDNATLVNKSLIVIIIKSKCFCYLWWIFFFFLGKVESNNCVGVHYYDFHILYSASYGVPVLFFRGYRIGNVGMLS